MEPFTRPDVMNDPQFDTVSAPSHTAADDPDKCRICHSEGSAEEPLFYPCKCSGSIKFVHQDCLIGWLAHSHKKHCELCKTIFCFTKLYHPQTPSRLPTTVFVRRAVVHIATQLLTLCRGLLVGFVWLLGLPWCMRIIWRACFLCGDGDLSSNLHRLSNYPPRIAAPTDTAPTSVGDASSSLNVTTGEPMAYVLIKAFIFGYGPVPDPVNSSLTDPADNDTLLHVVSIRQSTLLSDVSFLASLTSHPSVNRLILDIIEGQIITVLVFIAMIVVFLIREWVIQQVPALNPALGPVEPHQDAGPDPIQEGGVYEPPHVDDGDAEEEEDDDEDEDDDDDDDHDDDPLSDALGDTMDPFTSVNVSPDGQTDGFGVNGEEQHADSPMEGSSQQRPIMPERGQSLLAAEIKRKLEEETRGSALLDENAEEQVADPEGEDRQRPGNGSEGSWQQITKSDSEARESTLSDLPHTDPCDRSGSAATGDGDAPSPSSSASNSASGAVRDEKFPSSSRVASPDSPFDQDTPVAVETTARLAPPAPSKGLCERLYDWLWGDIALPDEDVAPGANDEHVVQNLADELPFVPRGAILGNGDALDNVDAANAANAARDQDAPAPVAPEGIDVVNDDEIEAAEDLEGIMELIGMQGPLVGLFQNSLLCAVLMSVVVAFAVWIPYISGKVVLLLLGRPSWLFLKLPLSLLSITADLIVDSILLFSAALAYLSISAIRFTLPLHAFHQPLGTAASSTYSFAHSTIDRMTKAFTGAGTSVRPDYLYLSTSSHAALRSMQRSLNDSLGTLSVGVADIHNKMGNMESFSPFTALVRFAESAISLTAAVASSVRASLPSISTAHGLSVQLNMGNATVAAIEPDPELWTSGDRIIAILAGYTFFAVVGALYLRRGKPFFSSQKIQRVESFIFSALQQAGGVLKVILIISIEMIAFPLYCGILLDGALLPLFHQATLRSRIDFAQSSPWTAGFVHWIVGTGYMFHFALFVSMCRKIMRKGVLYFIRDPDDPTFHPVRDVLERSVAGQLRKIAFSAFVYGALVICCLGGVVWSLHFGFESVLPIHWKAIDPSMEFSFDLLCFNVLTPLALKRFKPSDGLYWMYQWWFHQCARVLRISEFLFGEKIADERGRHVRRTWAAWFLRKHGDVDAPIIGHGQQLQAQDRGVDAYFLFDGRYVWAPASDQVRIRRGEPVFVDVPAAADRPDGRPQQQLTFNHTDAGLKDIVYVPPLFRLRICVFVVAIWLFAAATGVGFTVIPLLFGRGLFSRLAPGGSFNDIYAFSVGVYTLGGIAYSVFHLRHAVSFAANWARHPLNITYSTLLTLGHYAAQAVSLVYIYGALVVALPMLFALFLEFYVLIPLHTYLGPGETHVIHIIQDWTLGLLYGRMVARLLFANPRSILSRALQAVVRDGYLRPHARLATRAFVLPVVAFFAATLLAPLAGACLANATLYASASAATQRAVHTLAYPLTLTVALAVWTAWGAARATDRWRLRIKDEVYLIGERLHNLGDKRPGPSALMAPVQRRVDVVDAAAAAAAAGPA